MDLSNEDNNIDRVRLRIADHFTEAGFEKLEVTFKQKNEAARKIQNSQLPSDKGILIHSLSEMFRLIDKMSL